MPPIPMPGAYKATFASLGWPSPRTRAPAHGDGLAPQGPSCRGRRGLQSCLWQWSSGAPQRLGQVRAWLLPAPQPLGLAKLPSHLGSKL